MVMEIQATMPSTPHKPSKKPMWKGVLLAYIIIGMCYIPVALIGYWIFGNEVDPNILISLQNPKWLVSMANMFVVLHLIGGYQVHQNPNKLSFFFFTCESYLFFIVGIGAMQIYAMPVFDMIEAVLVKKLKFKLTWYLRFISRTSYVGKNTFSRNFCSLFSKFNQL